MGTGTVYADIWSKRDDLAISLHRYSHLIYFYEHAKNTHWRKGSLSNNGAGKAGYQHVDIRPPSWEEFMPGYVPG